MDTAVLATLVSSRTATLLGQHENKTSALTGSYQLAYGAGALFVAVGVPVSLFVLRQPTPPTAPVPQEEPTDATSAPAS
ncbi:hypothetical protein ABZW18_21160 [Streptomyces sp. NPDC004647]|uniref:hypothetical protein n=1 Tax=Streptomyces sp. NPDC004647 TaxID=3154671 RepID=UPI0033A2A3E6